MEEKKVATRPEKRRRGSVSLQSEKGERRGCVFSSLFPLVTQALADVDDPFAIIASVRYSRCSSPFNAYSPFLF